MPSFVDLIFFEMMDVLAKQNTSARNRSTMQTAAAAEAGPSSSSATRVIVSPSGGRHRRKASPERFSFTLFKELFGSQSSFYHFTKLCCFNFLLSALSVDLEPFTKKPF